MKIVFSLPNPNDPSGIHNFFNFDEIEAALDKYYTRVGVAPGVIYMSSPLYRDFIRSCGNERVRTLPASKKQYIMHYHSVYGVLPIVCEFKNKEYEIGFSPSKDFEEEFEKIILGDK